MKQYKVTNKKKDSLFGIYNSLVEANTAVIKYIEEYNKRQNYDSNCINIFDFNVEEIDNSADNLDAALAYLDRENNQQALIYVDKRYKESMEIIHKLLVINEAWNKEDNFIPDYINNGQDKYHLMLEFKDDNINAEWFYSYRKFQTLFAFKNHQRAVDFAELFKDDFKRLHDLLYKQRETEEIEETKYKIERYNGRTYYFITDAFVVGTDIDNDFSIDKGRYGVGNYFRTEEDAQAALDKLKSLLAAI